MAIIYIYLINIFDEQVLLGWLSLIDQILKIQINLKLKVKSPVVWSARKVMTDPMMYAASINRNLYIAPSIFSQTVTSSSVESFSCFPPEGRSATEPAGQVELSSESLGPMGTLGGWWWHGMWKSLGSPKRSPGRLPPAVTAQPKPDPALRTCSSASQLFWQVCPL